MGLTGPKSSCSKASFHLQALEGSPISLPCPASRGLLYSLAGGPFLCLRNQQWQDELFWCGISLTSSLPPFSILRGCSHYIEPTRISQGNLLILMSVDELLDFHLLIPLCHVSNVFPGLAFRTWVSLVGWWRGITVHAGLQLLINWLFTFRWMALQSLICGARCVLEWRFLVVRMGVCSFPRAAITEHHKLGGLKQ